MAKIENTSKRHTLLKQLLEKPAIVTTPHGLQLEINKDVFVPTAETFQLINIAKKILRSNSKLKIVVDIGTGSGIIAITHSKMAQHRKKEKLC